MSIEELKKTEETPVFERVSANGSTISNPTGCPTVAKILLGRETNSVVLAHDSFSNFTRFTFLQQIVLIGRTSREKRAGVMAKIDSRLSNVFKELRIVKPKIL